MRRILIARKRGIDFFVFQLIALKLGYWNRLNIMKERKSKSGGSTNRQLPSRCSPSAHQSRNNVIDAIKPAAAGIGKPVKFFAPLLLPSRSEFADAMLKRARRSAPHARYTKAMIQQARGKSLSTTR